MISETIYVIYCSVISGHTGQSEIVYLDLQSWVVSSALWQTKAGEFWLDCLTVNRQNHSMSFLLLIVQLKKHNKIK